MKRIIHSLVLLFACTTLFAQQTIPSSNFSATPLSAAEYQHVKALKQGLYNNNGTGSNRAIQNLVLDYAGTDDSITVISGNTSTGYAWNINKNYPSDSAYDFSLRWAGVFYDSLYDDPSLASYAYADAQSVVVDSVYFFVRHNNTTANIDTIIFSTYTYTDAAPMQLDVNNKIANAPAYADTFYVNTSVSPTTFGAFATYPNITLAAGERFAVVVDFYGDTANTFEVIGTFADRCSQGCAAYPSAIPDNSVFEMIFWNGTTDLTGVNPIGGYNCPTGATQCDQFYLQNLNYMAFVTADIQQSGGPTPVADFVATPTTIDEGQSVTFTDASTNSPTTWSWSFPGGNPSVSSLQTPPAVTYANPGAYNVTLTVTNANGTDTETKTSYITVNAIGGSGGTCDTLTNIFTNDTVNLFTVDNGWGFVSGHNSFTDASKAEQFTAAGTQEINQAILFFGAASFASASSSVDVSIWDDNGTGGAPGTVLATETVLLSDISLDVTNGDPTIVDFTTPPTVTGTFYVGIQLTYAAGDTIGLITTQDRGDGLGTAWEEFSAGGGWFPYNSASSWEIDVAHYIFVEACDVTVPLDADFVASPTTIFEGGSVNFTDLTAGSPISWSWSFPSAATTTSTDQNPSNIVYNTAGTFDVTLVATDASGNDTETKASYITVLAGGNSFLDCDTFSNLFVTDTANLFSSTAGYVTGHNNFGDISKAEFFVNQNPGVDISEVLIPFAIAEFGTPASSINVSVWDASGAAGSPGAVIATESVLLSDIAADIATGDATLVTFATPAAPTGNYYVGIEFTYAAGDTVALIQTQDPNTAGVNTAWEQFGSGDWFAFSDVNNSWGTTTSLYVFPIQCVPQACPTITVNTNASNTICTATNGAVSATPSGGATPYSYIWNTTPVQNGATITGLDAGIYTVTVTDANGCTGTGTDTVSTSFSNVVANATATDATCAAADGSARSIPSGGNTPYAYNWSTTPAQTTATATGLVGGVYTVTVTDANGCTALGTVTVGTSNGNLTGVATTTDATCTASDGTATITGSNGATPYTYNWSTTPAQTTATATGLIAGSYTVTVLDANGCSITRTVSVVANNGTLAATTATTNATCGNADGTATVTATGGNSLYTYNWSTVPVQTTQTAINLLAGTYDVTVTDGNGCRVTSAATVLDPGSPIVSQTAGNNVSCFGGSDGAVTVNVAGGNPPYTYTWSVAGSGPVLTGLSPGVVGLTVSDNSGCSATFSTTITQPAAALSVATGTITDITCAGVSNGSIATNVTGGTAPYSYSWNTAPNQTTATATGLAVGTYIVTVTDLNGCTATTSGTVGQPSNSVSVSVNSSQTSGCGLSDASLTANVTGGAGPFTYTWSNTQSGATATNLAAGVYSVTVVDGGGCSVSASGTVSDPGAQSASAATTPVSCYGSGNGSVTVNVTGGSGNYTYNWSPAVAGSSNNTATGLDGGSYDITVTDNVSNCVVAVTAFVNEPDSISVVLNKTDVTCFGGSNGTILAAAAGGNGGPYTYTWLPSGSTGSAITGLTAGNVILTVADASGCDKNFTINVAQPTAIALSPVISNVSCNGGSDGSATVTASGGAGNYSLVWNTIPTQTGATANGLTAGSYAVTATDGSGCIAAQSVTVTQPTALTATATANNVSCAGGTDGSATVSTSGGTGAVGYTWGTSPAQTGATATGLAAGAYTVTATDANGCTATALVTVTQPTPINLSATKTDVTCSGGTDGTASASATGGTGVIGFSWSTTPVQTGASISGLAAGPYTVTATDANGCSSTATVNVANGAAVTATAAVTDASCNGGADGTITLTTAGGTAPYTVGWSGGASGATRNNLAAGNYAYTVTDANGCSTTGSVTVNQASAVTITPNPTSTLCNGEPSGQITITVSGGAAPYSYIWSNGDLNQNLTGVAAGTYGVTVTDANGCAESATNLVVNEATVISLSTSSTSSTATATATGGTGIIGYEWSNGVTGATISNLAPGTYTVTATDANGCDKVATVDVITGIEDIVNLTSFDLFPNPTTGLVTVKLELDKADAVSIEWFNLLGEQVIAEQYENTANVEGKFDLGHFAGGIYIAKITYGGKSIMKKVVVGK